MKCVAVTRCQSRDGKGKIRTFEEGDVFEFAACPANFRPLSGEAKKADPIDFDTAKEQELLETDYNIEELRRYIEERYDRKTRNRGKEKLVEMLLDCRFRDIGDVDLDKVL